MKYFLPLIFILMLYSCSNAQLNTADSTNIINTELQKVLDTFVKDKRLKNCGVGFFCQDLTTSKTVGELNPDLTLNPASTLKIFTTATALEIFGSTYRYETVLEYDSVIDKNGVLQGSLYIKGGGDPVLGSLRFAGNYYSPFFLDSWISAIQKAGIKKIKGAVIADDRLYRYLIVPPSRVWEDAANYYGAGACALSIYDDLFTAYFHSGSSSGDSTYIQKIKPEIPGLKIENYVKASNYQGDEAYFYGSQYTYDRYAYGTIPKGQDSFEVKGAIPDPAWFCAYELNKRLEKTGIVVDKEPTTVRKLMWNHVFKYPKRKKIYTQQSPTLAEIVNVTNKVSFNLYPEHLLVHIGLKKKGEGATELGAKAVKEFWATCGMDTDGLYMNDGSGLTKYNFVTARQMVFLLNYMKSKSSNYTSFNNSLPVAGISGTLARVGKGSVAEGRVRAKSGSISRVRAYSGYVSTKSGKELAFSILVNNYNCTDGEMRNKLETLMITLAGM